MLLLDDDDELPATPDEAETALATQLGSDGLKAIDAALLAQAGKRWLKVARIVGDALKAGGFDPWEDAHLHLHIRRLIALVDAGALEAQGNLRKPRWSEVRLPELSLDALEQRLEAEPESEELRVQILRRCYTPELWSSARRLNHVLEYVRRFPRTSIARSPFVHFDPTQCPGEFQQVEGVWLELRAGLPEDPSLALGHAACVATGDRERAAQILRAALQTSPQDAKLWTELGRTGPDARERLQALLNARRLGGEQPNLLTWTAHAAMDANDLGAAESIGSELLSLVAQARSEYGEALEWRERQSALYAKAYSTYAEPEQARALIDAISDRDQRVHWGHTALGVVAARRGDMPAACEHLALSANVPGDPRLRSYGPSFLLARELCAHGEWQAVDDYLQACKAFWETDLLEELRQEVQRREIPDFPEQ